MAGLFALTAELPACCAVCPLTVMLYFFFAA
ncbi:MAG: hypothetical protein ACI80M_001563, partial [Gammaproteobacteria bacterium]